MPASTKNLLLRLEPQLAAQLSALAEVEGQTVSDVVREAIAAHVRQRQRDPAFKRLLRAHAEQHRELLARLAEDDDR
jgi:predicted transcriptional regulator